MFTFVANKFKLFVSVCVCCVLLSILTIFPSGGIESGDIIVKLNGQPLASTEDLQEALLGENPLLLEVRRGNDDLLFNLEPHVIMQ